MVKMDNDFLIEVILVFKSVIVDLNIIFFVNYLYGILNSKIKKFILI